MTLSDWPEEDVGVDGGEDDVRSLSLSQVAWPPQVVNSKNNTHIMSSASSSSSTGGGVNSVNGGPHPFPASAQGGRRPSVQKSFQAKRKPSVSTVITSMSSITDNSSSILGGGNIWTRILSNQKETLWDKLGDANGHDDEDDDNGSLGWGNDPVLDGTGGCTPAIKLCTLTAMYESKHFINTIRSHPRILLISLAVTALVCGLGIVAIESESRSYVNKQRNLAELKVSCCCCCSLSYLCLTLLLVKLYCGFVKRKLDILTIYIFTRQPNTIIYTTILYRQGRLVNGLPMNSVVPCFPYTRSNRALSTLDTLMTWLIRLVHIPIYSSPRLLPKTFHPRRMFDGMLLVFVIVEI
jgi:hypothetical protein